MSEVKTMKDFWAPDCKTVFVLGAGMEMGKDIGLCSAEMLPIEIMRFINSAPDKKVDNEGSEQYPTNVLKKNVETVESFESIITKRFDKMFQNRDRLAEKVTKVKAKYPENDYAEFFSLLIAKIEDVTQPNNEIETVYNRIRNRNGVENLDPNPGHLIDVERLSFSQGWTEIIRSIVRSFVKGNQNFSEEDNECLCEFVKGVVDYDRLLTDNYIGFYSGDNKASSNRYRYLSWLLWCYLANLDKRINHKETIYSRVLDFVNSETSFVTMNYSTFLDRALKENGLDEPIHFHGDLTSYIVKWKEEEMSTYYDNDISNLLSNWIPIGSAIPSMMPPLTIKPLISDKYLERWVKVKNLIDAADRIIVVGYSFSSNDNHFNNLIYNAEGSKNKSIVVVNPSVKDELKEALKRYKKYELIQSKAEDFFEYKGNK